MDKQLILKSTANHVKMKLEGDGSGHDWLHIECVRRNARNIMKDESCDNWLVEMIALLHESIDYKLDDDEQKMEDETREFLTKMQLGDLLIDELIYAIQAVSFKGGKNPKKPKNIETIIVQDADKLEAIGAVGIARCFAYGGHKGSILHDPLLSPKDFATMEDYKKNKSTSINHFYEKLLKLKGLMNTSRGKKIAQKRHEFMEQYLEQFYAERNGER